MLSEMPRRAREKGIFAGINLGGENLITYQQFADDTIIFINIDEQSIIGIKNVIQCFQLLSRLKINF